MKDGLFTFKYKIEGIKCENVENIFITIISGSSSFTDYLVFYSENPPLVTDSPLYLIEETKTGDSESRNTAAYQRSSKFVYASFFYPKVPKIMLYSLRVAQRKESTSTSVFGTKLLATLGVEILGRILQKDAYSAFSNIDELIELKNEMSLPHYGLAVRINKVGDVIKISARLEKSGYLSHDPNIGMTTVISACLRKLGWKGRIVITDHGLASQKNVGVRNKFIAIANQLGVELENLTIPRVSLHGEYWKVEANKEKIGTIFTSILCEEFTDSVAIYENHGGCERGYFISEKNKENIEYLAVPKFSDREKYKAGDKSYIISIPDLVLYDRKRDIIINAEGKVFAKREEGYKEIGGFDSFEDKFIKKYYPGSEISRTLILSGSKDEAIDNPITGLLLNQDGLIVLGEKTPLLFKEAVANLLSL